MVVSIEQHVDWIGDCLDAHARAAASTTIEPTADGRGGLGAARQRLRRHHALSRGPTPGTWAPTCRASRGCSCPTSAASIATARPATRSCAATTSASRFDGPGGTRCNDGVVRRAAARRRDPARADRGARAAAARVAVGRRRARVHRSPSARDAAARARGGRDRRRRAARCRPATLAYRLYRPASAGPAPDRRLLPRRRLGARQPRLRRSVLPRPLRAVRRRSSCRSTTATRPRPASPPRSTTAFAAVQLDRRPTPRRWAACRASWRCAAGAPAATSPPSSASWRATPAARAIAGQVLVTPVTDCDFDARVVRRQRRGLRAHRRADALVLGPLRRPGRPHATRRRRRCAPTICPACRRRSSSRASSTRCATRAPPTPRRWRPPASTRATSPVAARSTRRSRRWT